MRKVVLTGFGPFGSIEENPSSIIVKKLQLDEALNRDVLVCSKILEVSIEGVEEGLGELDAQVLSYGLDQSSCIYIHLGVYDSEKVMRLECRAFNDATFGSPDVRGNTPYQKKIVEEDDMNRIRYSTLDLETLCSDLRMGLDKCKCTVTDDPGRFLCNYVYYKSLCMHDNVVFVHVPGEANMNLTEQTAFVKCLLHKFLASDYVIPATCPAVVSHTVEQIQGLGFNRTQIQRASYATDSADASTVVSWILDNSANTQPIKTFSDLSALRNTEVEEHKMVVVVNSSLNMSCGKIASQVGHVVLALQRGLTHSNPSLLSQWLSVGEPLIVCKVKNIEDMNSLEECGKSFNLPTFSIRDAGRTEVMSGSKTVLAIGPGLKSVVDNVTGNLELL